MFVIIINIGISLIKIALECSLPVKIAEVGKVVSFLASSSTCFGVETRKVIIKKPFAIKYF